MSPAAVPQDRHDLRRHLIATREALPPALAAQLRAALLSHLDALLARLAPASLGYCWPYRGEPDLRDWVAQWLADVPARRAALPVVGASDAPLTWRRWTPGCALLSDRHGIPYPAAGESFVPQLLLIPVNGFDARGFRLGYGAGYFDRTLAALSPAPVSVGLGYELARLPDLQPQPHDRPLDWIVTEAGVVVAPPDAGCAS